jgi:hypothetical protein
LPDNSTACSKFVPADCSNECGCGCRPRFLLLLLLLLLFASVSASASSSSWFNGKAMPIVSMALQFPHPL